MSFPDRTIWPGTLQTSRLPPAPGQKDPCLDPSSYRLVSDSSTYSHRVVSSGQVYLPPERFISCVAMTLGTLLHLHDKAVLAMS